SSTEKMEVLSKIFDTRAASAMAILLDVNAEEWEKLGEAISKTGTVQELSTEMMETTQGKMLQLEATIESLKISIGEKLAPMLAEIIDKFRGIVEAITEGDVLGAIQQFGGLVFTVFQRAYNTITTLFNNLITWLQGIDWGGIGQQIYNQLYTGLGSLGQMFNNWITNTDWKSIANQLGQFIRQAFINALDIASNILDAIGAWLESILNNPDIIDKWFQAAEDWLEGLWEGLVNPTSEEKGKNKVLELIQKIFYLTGKIVVLLGQFAVTLIGKLGEKIVENAPKLLGFLQDAFTKVFTDLGNTITDIVNQHVVNPVIDIVNSLDEQLGGLLSKSTKTMNEFNQMMISVLKGDWNSAVEHAKNVIRGLRDTIKTVFDKLWDFVGPAVESFKKSLKESWDKLVQALKDKFMEFVTFVPKKIGELGDKIKGFFEGIYDKLVGHSIWVDMIDEMMEYWDKGVEEILWKTSELRKGLEQEYTLGYNMGYSDLGPSNLVININIEEFHGTEESIDKLSEEISRKIVEVMYT
ncbi:MAG: phage tail tape measure protein, partial [Candidatus Aenigmatarchaeota archaeon]